MESWDLFDTLVAGRHLEHTGDFVGELYPIAEAIARVKPDDIIISDYYTHEAAEAVLRNVTRLPNKLIVTPDSKRTGALWDEMRGKVERHHGDNPVGDFEQPKLRGISAELMEAHKLTAVEQMIWDNSMPGLAYVLREARLRTWHDRFRPLQLLQIEINFPLLVMAAIKLHEFAVAKGARTLLMSARDCCLWVDLQRVICDRLKGGYTVEYFPSSRDCRNNPSDTYMRELNDRLKQSTVLVDVTGTGESLTRLLLKSQFPETPVFIVFHYAWRYEIGIDLKNVFGLAPFFHPRLEGINSAMHSQYIDWYKMKPAKFDWEREEISVMHRAFKTALGAFSHCDTPIYSADIFENLLKFLPEFVGNNLDFLPRDGEE